MSPTGPGKMWKRRTSLGLVEVSAIQARPTRGQVPVFEVTVVWIGGVVVACEVV